MALISLSQTAPVTSLSALQAVPAKAVKPTQPNPAPTPPPTSIAAASKPAANAKGTAHGSSGGGASSSAAATDAAVYTTSVGGKTYSGTVQYSNGQYFVCVPGLNGAVATGSSAQSAEDNLGNIISILA